MSGELCGRAARAFIDALRCYLRSNALRTAKIASLTGQKKVKVSLRAFMRCHDPSSGFARVEDVVNALTRCSEGSWIQKLGWDYILDDDEEELYFVVPLEYLLKLMHVDDDELTVTLLDALGLA